MFNSIKSSGRQIALYIFILWTSIACHPYFAPVDQARYTRLQIDSTRTAQADYVQFYQPYKQQLDKEMNRVIGQSALALTKPNAPETLLGNFFADALLQQGRKLNPAIDIAFGTKGGLRTDLPQGDITVRHLYELMPFENELVVLTLSGKQIDALARFIASTGGQPVAGLSMHIVKGKPRNIRIRDTPLDIQGKYVVLTYDYLANGGDHIQGFSHPLERNNLGIKVRECLMDYVEACTSAGQVINTQLDGRIKIDE